MFFRFVSLAIMAVLISCGTLAYAKEAKVDLSKKTAARTWRNVADYVIANGTERPLSASITQSLGLGTKPVITKALRYKPDIAPDKMTHALYIVTEKDKEGKSKPKEIVLGNRFVIQKGAVKSIDDFFIRTDLNGSILAAYSSKGPSGGVVEKKFPVDSPEVVASYKSEKKIHLETMSLENLSK